MHLSGGDGAEAQARRILFGLGFDKLMQVCMYVTGAGAQAKHVFWVVIFCRETGNWGLQPFGVFLGLRGLVVLWLLLNVGVVVRRRANGDRCYGKNERFFSGVPDLNNLKQPSENAHGLGTQNTHGAKKTLKFLRFWVNALTTGNPFWGQNNLELV